MLPAADPVRACATCHRTAQTMASDRHGSALRAGSAAAPTCVTCHGSHDVLPTSNVQSRAFPANVSGRCSSCHLPALRSYSAGVHATVTSPATGAPAASCVDCHAPHDVRGVGDTVSTVSRQRVAGTCAACHALPGMAYDVSVHASALRRGGIQAATCVDCHGGHEIRPVRRQDAPTATLRVAATCASCHDNVRLIANYALRPTVPDFRASFHALSGNLGDRRAANCASCHGYHEIRPSWDPQSRIHPDNVPATCGSCHAGVSASFARGGIHHAPRTPGHRFVDVARAMYMGMIVVVITLMVLHNALDFTRRWRDRRAASAASAPTPARASRVAQAGTYVRFTRNERVQHWVLAGSFIVLLVSGFALVFGWNVPGLAPQTGAVLRAWGHRVAAIVLLVLGTYHLCYLAFSQRGRATARALWPRFDRAANVACCAGSCLRLGPPSVSDWRDLVQMVRYNLGRTRERPRFGRFTYAEKMEYFALLWGTVIMAGTGVILWLEVPFLNRFPSWSLELATVIHLYEAILATLAIVVWHFYYTILNPDVFPLSRAMITGTLSREEMEREHPAELTEQEPPAAQ